MMSTSSTSPRQQQQQQQQQERLTSPANRGGGGGGGTSLSSRPLIRPSLDVPWSVEIVSAVPQSVMKNIMNQEEVTVTAAIAAASSGRWHCVATTTTTTTSNDGDGDVVLHVWFDSPSDSLQVQMSRGPILQLRHQQLNNFIHKTSSTTCSAVPEDASSLLLLAMETAPSSTSTTFLQQQNKDVVFLYAAHCLTGALVVWKVSRRDLSNISSSNSNNSTAAAAVTSAICFVPLQHKSSAGQDEEEETHEQTLEVLTSLHVCWKQPAAGTGQQQHQPMIVLGTSNGRLFWIQQKHVPMTLHAMLLPAIHSNSSSSRKSGFFSFWTRATGGGNGNGNQGGASGGGDAIFRTLPKQQDNNNNNNNSFFAIFKHGRIAQMQLVQHQQQQQQLQQQRAPLPSSFEATVLMDLFPALQEYFSSNTTTTSTTTTPRLTGLVVLSATTTTNNNNNNMHVIVLTQHEQDHAHRIYWVHLVAMQTTNSTDASTSSNNNNSSFSFSIHTATWLNRFTYPAQVAVSDIVVTCDDQQTAYAAFTGPSLPVIVVMAMEFHSNSNTTASCCELDLDALQVGRVWTLDRDLVTHGCFALTTLGLGLRVRRIVLAQETTTSSSSIGTACITTNKNPALCKTLMSHLRSSFLDAYNNPSLSVPLPPSLQTAERTDLELVVLLFGQQLSSQSSSSSPPPRQQLHLQFQQCANPLELYSAYVNFLQQSGLYRSLSTYCHWKLLAMGQQVAVYQEVTFAQNTNGQLQQQQLNTNIIAWENSTVAELASDADVAAWLLNVQTSVLADAGAGEDRRQRFVDWLCTAVTVAASYKEERLSLVYDIASPREIPLVALRDQVPLWTSHPVLQAVLQNQLSHWQTNGNHFAAARVDQVETVVTAALVSFADSYHSCPISETQTNYAQIQKDAIQLLRKKMGKENDQLAFELSREHGYFAGICEIAYEHESKSDSSNFGLEPLLETMPTTTTDVLTGLTFAAFCCHWHCAEGLLGHALKYGKKYCPATLAHLTETNEAMRPYRWICAIQNGNYEEATDSLLENAENEHSNLATVKQNLGIASIANTVVEKEMNQHSSQETSKAIHHCMRIEKMRELVNAQEELLGPSLASSPSSRLWSADRLLDLALRQCDEAQGKDEKIRACFLGLAVCTTFASHEMARTNAATVWSKAVREDWPLWEKWVKSSCSLTGIDLANAVREATVFGGLVSQCGDVESWDDVLYIAVEQLVCQKLSGFEAGFVSELRRILHSAADVEPLGLVSTSSSPREE